MGAKLSKGKPPKKVASVARGIKKKAAPPSNQNECDDKSLAPKCQKKEKSKHFSNYRAGEMKSHNSGSPSFANSKNPFLLSPSCWLVGVAFNKKWQENVIPFLPVIFQDERVFGADFFSTKIYFSGKNRLIPA